MIQVGVVSWGMGNPPCGDGSSPGVYSLVWSDRAFIEQHATGAIFGGQAQPPLPPLSPPSPPHPPPHPPQSWLWR